MFSGFRVLLAEDCAVNQDVGRAMIETFGCRVDVASNGLEALQLTQSNRYDLVFMDCQMPEMDGWEAARRIREAEDDKDYRTPIVALTAYMMDEELAKCTAAGMDGHLGKPYGLKQLSETLTRWLEPKKRAQAGPPQSGGAAQAGPENAGRPDSSLDPTALNNLRSALGSGAFKTIKRVIEVYLADSPSYLEELRRATRTRDSEALGRAAHTLKSSSANLGANVLAGLCKEIELIARSNSTEGAEDLIRRIETEYGMVDEALTQVLGKGE